VLAAMDSAWSALNIVILDVCRGNIFSGSRSAARGLAVVGILMYDLEKDDAYHFNPVWLPDGSGFLVNQQTELVESKKRGRTIYQTWKVAPTLHTLNPIGRMVRM